MKSFLRWILRGLGALGIAILLAWSVLAIRFSNLPGETLRIAAAGAFGLGWAAALLFLPRRGRRALWFLVAFAAVLAWWWWIPASNDRDWPPWYARTATAEIDGDRVTVRNLRNFEYRTETDFDARWEDRTFDLRDLAGVDFVKSHWDKIADVAHTMFSFWFRKGEASTYLTVSIETRRERGEVQTGLRGLFKQYEVIYILGDERDLLRLRTDCRKEDVFIYPTRATPAEARALLLDILETANGLAARPRFYNTLTSNCTTSFFPHIEKVRPRKSLFDIRFLLNGRIDELGLANGWIDSDLDLREARKLHWANQYVTGPYPPAEYSRRIRPWRGGS